MPAKRTAEVVIIGAGVVGASIAWHLTQSGCRDVLLLDRERAAAGGSTGRATGGARAQFATSPEIAMSLHSLEAFTRFEELTGVSAGYRPCGYLFLATTAEQLATLHAAREKQQAAGLRDVEMLTGADVNRLVPGLRTDDIAGAAFRQQDGLIDPRAILRGYLAGAERGGARVEFGSAVDAIEVAGGRVTGVRIHHTTITAPVVVNAAGAWSSSLMALLGIPLPVTPLRRQIAGARCRTTLPEQLPMVIDMGSGFHFRRDAGAGDDAWLLAWPEPDTAPGFETRYEDSFGERVLELAARRCPPLAAATIDHTRCRAGLYEMTPDHRAIIDRAPGVDGLFVATGFSGHGVMHAPATGRIVADLILHGTSGGFDIGPLRAGRFAEGVAPEIALL